MANGTGAAAGSSADAEQSFTPAALRGSVKLSPGTQIKIAVIGVSGKPLTGGRSSSDLYTLSGGAGTGSAGSGSAGGSGGPETFADSSDDADGSGSANGDSHVIAAEVRGIDGQLLPNQAVRVYDADGNVVTEGTTDEQGVLRVDVDKEGDYQIELVDDSMQIDLSEVRPGGADPVCLLRVLFTDANGAPVAGEAVTVDTGDGTFELTTDDAGAIETSGPLRSYELTLHGQKFVAHSMPAADHADGKNPVSFTLAAEAA